MKYSAEYSYYFYNDLAIATDNLSQYSGTASARFKALLRDRINKAQEMPMMFASHPDAPRYRHIVVGKYVLIYRVEELAHRIYLYRLLHGSHDIKSYL
jgi:plasmid stabilization system protein ParE